MLAPNRANACWACSKAKTFETRRRGTKERGKQRRSKREQKGEEQQGKEKEKQQEGEEWQGEEQGEVQERKLGHEATRQNGEATKIPRCHTHTDAPPPVPYSLLFTETHLQLEIGPASVEHGIVHPVRGVLKDDHSKHVGGGQSRHQITQKVPGVEQHTPGTSATSPVTPEGCVGWGGAT
jgi:hypothetical protein